MMWQAGQRVSKNSIKRIDRAYDLPRGANMQRGGCRLDSIQPGHSADVPNPLAYFARRRTSW